MHLPAVTSSPALLASPYGGEPGVPVAVMLLGVRVADVQHVDEEVRVDGLFEIGAVARHPGAAHDEHVRAMLVA